MSFYVVTYYMSILSKKLRQYKNDYPHVPIDCLEGHKQTAYGKPVGLGIRNVALKGQKYNPCFCSCPFRTIGLHLIYQGVTT